MNSKRYKTTIVIPSCGFKKKDIIDQLYNEKRKKKKKRMSGYA